MRAPSAKVLSAIGSHRQIDLHYHASTKAEESGGTYRAPADYLIVALNKPGAGSPTLRLRAMAGADGTERQPFLHVECDELIALGALATITCEAEPEDFDPADSFEFPDDIERARKAQREGDTWGWCQVTVRATWAGHSGEDHLGGCAYGSREEFMAPGGYFDDMVRNALSALREEIERHGHR